MAAQGVSVSLTVSLLLCQCTVTYSQSATTCDSACIASSIGGLFSLLTLLLGIVTACIWNATYKRLMNLKLNYKKFKKGGNKNGAKEMSGALGEGTDYSNVQESSFDRPEKALADNLPKKSFLPCTPKVPPRNVPVPFSDDPQPINKASTTTEDIHQHRSDSKLSSTPQHSPFSSRKGSSKEIPTTPSGSYVNSTPNRLRKLQRSGGSPASRNSKVKMRVQATNPVFEKNKQVTDSELYEVLSSNNIKWSEIGPKLKFSESELRELGQRIPRYDKRLLELCSMWIEKHQEEATWDKVAEALRELDRVKIADLIEGKYDVQYRSAI